MRWQTSSRIARILYSLVLVGFVACGDQAHATSEDDIKLNVEVQGSEVITDVEFFVRATPQETWAVLIDYDHATEFISGLQRSTILARSADMMMVSQKGIVNYGPFSATFDTVTESRLIPYETISSRMVSGNMKKNVSTTQIFQEAGGTRVVLHMESIPDVWIPPIIGRILIAHEVRSRFHQLIAEILRRGAERPSPQSGHQD